MSSTSTLWITLYQLSVNYLLIVSILVNGTDMEKPGPDASMNEKMRYLEEGFWDSFAEGMYSSSIESAAFSS